MNEREFKAHLKKKEFSGLYVITGEEKFLVRHYTNELVKRAMGEKPADFNYHELDSKTTVDRIAVAADVMPFMSKYNFVKITDFDFTVLVKSELDSLTKLLKNLPETTVVLFTFPTAEPTGTGYNSLLNTAKKIGTVLELEHLSKLKLGATLVEGAYSRGCSMSENTAGMLIDYCGDDLVALRNELDKLCAFADGQEITVDMIEQLVYQKLDTKLYYFTDKVLYGNLDKAYADLDILFYQKTEPIVIISAIGGVYTDIYRAKVAAESGVPLAKAAEDFGYGKRKFALEKAAKHARSMSTAQIRKSIDEIMKVDVALKSTAVNGRTAIEKLIAKLVLIKQGTL